MATVTSGRGKSAVSVDVELVGFFFSGNPVGRLHRNTYAVLRDEGAVAVAAASDILRSRQQQTGGGYPDIALADEMRAVPMRMRRGTARLVVSANYGTHPLARKYNRWVEDATTARPRGGFRGYHMYREGARITQSHIDGRIGSIADKLVEGLV
jgi:hypothetical protein